MVVAINLQLESQPGNITVHCNPETMETKVEDDKVQPVECQCQEDCQAIRIELEQKENVKNKRKLDLRERQLEVRHARLYPFITLCFVNTIRETLIKLVNWSNIGSQ